MTDDRHAAGQRIRRDVLGDEHVDRAEAAVTPFTAAFQDFIARTAWGDVWARPGLDRRTRSAITLAMLTALRADGEIALHVRAAIRNGLTEAEIGEILLQAAVYAGVPAANTAFTIAGRVLADAPFETTPAPAVGAELAHADGTDAQPASGAESPGVARADAPPANGAVPTEDLSPSDRLDPSTTGRKERSR